MEIQKIEKLIKSKNYSDVLIAIELFDNLSKDEFEQFISKYKSAKNKESCFEIKLNCLTGIPDDIYTIYKFGYFFAIFEKYIYIDDEEVAKKRVLDGTSEITKELKQYLL